MEATVTNTTARRSSNVADTSLFTTSPNRMITKVCSVIQAERAIHRATSFFHEPSGEVLLRLAVSQSHSELGLDCAEPRGIRCDLACERFGQKTEKRAMRSLGVVEPSLPPSALNILSMI